MVFLLGGIFPPAAVPSLMQIGINGTFPPGATKEEISGFIKKSVASKIKS